MIQHTGTPRLSRGLLACLFAHSVWLSLVLCHSGVDGSNLTISLPFPRGLVKGDFRTGQYRDGLGC